MSRNRTSAVATLLLALAPLSTGCGADGAAGQVEGRWDGPGRAKLELKSDGTAEGNDGCNDVAADWKSTNDTTGKFVITESSDMGCLSVIGWSDAAAYVTSGNTLIIEGADGVELSVLTRSD